MEQQTQAMCSMLAMLRARARGSITTGRERTRLCHFNIRSRQGTASWGFPVVGKATGRKEARCKESLPSHFSEKCRLVDTAVESPLPASDAPGL